MSVEKQKKIDREYCITDDSVNVYKYRLLTSGFLLDEFKKNPIGFLMHDRDNGVVVRWDDFRVDGDKVWAKPVINLSHPNGEAIAAQVENGFYNAASVGRIVCLDATDDATLKLADQTGPTITKWFPRECSLVDIPGNYNALAHLYDLEDNELNLADIVKPKNKNMKKVLIAASVLTALKLTDDTPDEAVNNGLQDLIDKAGKADQLAQDLAAKEVALVEKTKELNDLKAATTTKEVADLIAKGKADKKLTVEVGEKLALSFAENPIGLKDLIDAMPAQTVVTASLDGASEGDYTGKTWAELYAKEGELEKVRKQFPDLYEKLKKERFPNLKE